MKKEIKKALEKASSLLYEAKNLISLAHDEAQEDYGNHSDAWQESDKGYEAIEIIDGLEEVIDILDEAYDNIDNVCNC